MEVSMNTFSDIVKSIIKREGTYVDGHEFIYDGRKYKINNGILMEEITGRWFPAFSNRDTSLIKQIIDKYE